MVRGTRGGRRGRPPGRKNQHVEREPPVERTELEQEVHGQPEDEDEVPVLEPIVRQAIAREVADVLRNTLDTALDAALQRAEARNRRIQIAEPETLEELEDEADSDDSDFDALRGCEYKSFRSCDPPSFDGQGNAIAAFRWIDSMSEVIRMSECRADQAVKYAAHSFSAEALSWWKNVKSSKTEREIERMTWDDLKVLVIRKFCPQNEIDKVEAEFVEFKAGNMTHRQFTSKYNELTQLVPHLINSEERRTKYYVQKLPPRVRTIIDTNIPNDFDSVVALSAKVYDNVAAEGPVQTEAQKKWPVNNKRFGDSLSAPGNKKVKQESTKSCEKCGKFHFGECKAGLNICYRCGKTGHISRDCQVKFRTGRCYNCGDMGHLAKDCRKPKEAGTTNEKKPERAGATTRAYAITKDEAKGNTDVVSDSKAKAKEP